MADPDAVGFWENRYAEREQVWSGEPNVALVEAARELTPGHALDLGCGEGADSVWLADRGWEVTAVDISATAIARAQARAVASGIPEGRIHWLVADLASWQPEGRYELVSACFLHSPVGFPRPAVLRRAAHAVVPGGHLLIVGHAEPPPWMNTDHADHAGHHFLGPDEELAGLELDDTAWEVAVSEVRQRDATGREGEPVTLQDAVVLLRRR